MTKLEKDKQITFRVLEIETELEEDEIVDPADYMVSIIVDYINK